MNKLICVIIALFVVYTAFGIGIHNLDVCYNLKSMNSIINEYDPSVVIVETTLANKEIPLDICYKKSLSGIIFSVWILLFMFLGFFNIKLT